MPSKAAKTFRQSDSFIERTGTSEAKEIVGKLSEGKAEAALTVAAKATLERMHTR